MISTFTLYDATEILYCWLVEQKWNRQQICITKAYGLYSSSKLNKSYYSFEVKIYPNEPNKLTIKGFVNVFDDCSVIDPSGRLTLSKGTSAQEGS